MPNDSVPTPATCEDDDRLINTLQWRSMWWVSFSWCLERIRSNRSRFLAKPSTAKQSQTHQEMRRDTPRSQIRHLTPSGSVWGKHGVWRWCQEVVPRRGKGNGDSGVVRFAVFANLLVGKISESKVFPKTWNFRSTGFLSITGKSQITNQKNLWFVICD